MRKLIVAIFFLLFAITANADESLGKFNKWHHFNVNGHYNVVNELITASGSFYPSIKILHPEKVKKIIIISNDFMKIFGGKEVIEKTSKGVLYLKKYITTSSSYSAYCWREYTNTQCASWVNNINSKADGLHQYASDKSYLVVMIDIDCNITQFLILSVRKNAISVGG